MMISANIYKLIKHCYFIGVAIIAVALAKPDLNAQSGFAKAIPIATNVNIDDILFHNDQLILRGNIAIDSLEIIGLLIVGLDTNGLLLWQSSIYDTALESHIILNTPGRFLISDDNRLILPVNYYNTGQLAVYFTDMEGNEEMHQFYDYGEGVIFPFDINQIGTEFYLSGVKSYPGGDLSLFVLKLKQNGEQVWIKHYGLSSQFEISEDADVNDDHTLTLYADRFDTDFLESEAKEGWKKPWILTIDTSGTIVEEWIGEQNDPRTLGGEFFSRMENGNWILQSTHYKNVPNDLGVEVRVSPTVTCLDSNFNQIWKVYLSDYEARSDRILDIEYDTNRQEIVCTGQKYIPIGNKFEFVNWTVKLDTAGQILWDTTDSVYYSRQNTHLTAGLDIAPSGSIYVGGYVTVNELEPRSRAFVIKYTSDGCSDTICSTTSIIEQIRQTDQPIVIYPNPASDILSVIVKETMGRCEFRLSNLYGQTVLTQKLEPGNHEIQLSLTKGVYIATFYKDNTLISSRKLVIQ